MIILTLFYKNFYSSKHQFLDQLKNQERELLNENKKKKLSLF